MAFGMLDFLCLLKLKLYQSQRNCVNSYQPESRYPLTVAAMGQMANSRVIPPVAMYFGFPRESERVLLKSTTIPLQRRIVFLISMLLRAVRHPAPVLQVKLYYPVKD